MVDSVCERHATPEAFTPTLAPMAMHKSILATWPGKKIMGAMTDVCVQLRSNGGFREIHTP
jgi:hypothetical protein